MRKPLYGMSHVQRLVVWSAIVGTAWSRPAYADEVLTLTGDNPNIGFIDNVGALQSWQILANDSGFVVRELTRIPISAPFKITPRAPDNSLVVSNNGNLGVRTVPDSASELHVLSSALNPIFRLENSSGDVWDIEADGNSFQIRGTPFDFSSTTPVRFEMEAPTNSLFVAANGGVGIGTALPNNTGAVTGTGKFFNVRADGASAATGVCNGVFQGTFGAQNHLVHLNGPVNQKIMRLQCSSGFFGLHVLNDTVTTKAVSDVLSIKMSNGNVGLRVQSPIHPLQLASGAHVTAGGVFTNASSRTIKKNVHPITSEQARETVRALQPVGYQYNEEPDEDYVGFIAEDVPELVATKDRKSLAPMDVVAVLTKVVQDQDQQNEQLRATLTQQQTRNDRLEATVNAMAQRLADLEAKSH